MLHSIALTFIPGITPSQSIELTRHYPNSEAIIMHPEETLRDLNAQSRVTIIRAIREGRDEALRQAQSELDFCTTYGISVLTYHSSDYPARLRDCPDAPPVLYYRGTAPLNARHILAVVGTRKITEYGKQVCKRLTERLAELLPDTLIISGLAYGVDIHAHRGSLDHGLNTVGVVAHGMDQIYPATHRNDAKRIVNQGGIITEYCRGTRPMQGNFLRRNRIIAGLADATIIVESASHGGSLVTARIAHSYNRSIFAFPGRINDPYSEGCNQLIHRNMAIMAISADNIIEEMGWWKETVPYLSQPQQLDLFTDSRSTTSSPFAKLTDEQQRIVQALQGTGGLTTTTLSQQTALTASTVATTLFDLEMLDIVRILPGGLYVLTK